MGSKITREELYDALGHMREGIERIRDIVDDIHKVVVRVFEAVEDELEEEQQKK